MFNKSGVCIFQKPIGDGCFGAIAYAKPLIFSLPLVFFSVFLHAQTSLTLSEAVEKSLSFHPEVAVMRYQDQSAEGYIQQAKVGRSSEILLTVEDAFGSGNYESFDAAQTTLSISWILQGGLTDDRVNAAKGQASVLHVENRIRQFDIAAQTAREFVQLLALQAKQSVEQQSLQNAKKALTEISRKVNAGKLPLSDQLRAEVNIENRALGLEDIEHEILSAQRLLAAKWGVTEYEFNEVAGDIALLPQLHSFEHIEGKLDKNPESQWFLTQARVLDAEIALAKSEARRRLQFNTGVRHYQESDDYSAVLSVSLPLGGEKRNRGKISALQADQGRLESEALANQIALKAKLFALYQELKHSQHIARTLDEKILPKLKAAEKDIRSGFQLGKYSYSEWALIQSELTNASLQRIESSVLAHLNMIEIERLTGQSLSTLDQKEQQHL